MYRPIDIYEVYFEVQYMVNNKTYPTRFFLKYMAYIHTYMLMGFTNNSTVLEHHNMKITETRHKISYFEVHIMTTFCVQPLVKHDR